MRLDLGIPYFRPARFSLVSARRSGVCSARMFTDRFTWSLDENPLTAALRARREAGAAVLDLTAANPTRVGLAWAPDVLGAALAHPAGVAYDPDPCGMRSAREAVCGHYRDAHATAVAPEDLVLTASTSEGYGWLIKLLTNPGDTVLAPAPSYPLLEFLGAMECVRVATYPLVARAGGWRVDEAALDAAVTPRTRAILVVNPNNPTGSVPDAADRAALRRVALRHGVPLVADEVFLDYPAGDAPAGAPPRTFADEVEAPVFVMSGFSKIAALPQVKLGWIAVAGASRFRREAMRRLEFVADTYLSVNTPVQLAAPAIFAGAEPLRARIRARCDANARRLADWCATSGHGVAPAPREAGWYACLRLPRGVGEEAATLDLIRREGVSVHPGHFFGFPPEEAWWVLSLLTPEPVFTAALPALDRTLRRL